MKQQQTGSINDFGPIRSCFWPIYNWEIKKILPMFLMIFLICFNQNVLRNMKDALVVTASGAEVIPFIKVWALLPTAILLTIIFTKLSQYFSQEKVFYLMTSGFLVTFAFFAFVVYPLRDALHPHDLADKMEVMLPAGFKGLISMFRYWSFTGFYVMAEMWSCMVLSVLFWGFANQVTRISEARRFYGVLGIGANLSAVAAGQSAIQLSQIPQMMGSFFTGREEWEQVQIVLVSVIIICGLATMMIFRWINRQMLIQNNLNATGQTSPNPIKKKQKLSFRESILSLSKSKHLMCIAVIVVSYNLVINLVEVVWKDQLRLIYPNPIELNTYMNNLTSAIGIFSTITAVFMAKIINRFGWTKTALITPVVMLVTCAGFFSFLFLKEHLSGLVITLLGTTPLVIAVFFGGVQNCLSKAAKFSVFDATSNMAYIPLDSETKLKGKAAIDGVGSRFGKSGSSFIHQILLMIFSTLTASAPYVAGFLFLVIGFWIQSVRSLGKQLSESAHNQNEQEAYEKTVQLEPSGAEGSASVINGSELPVATTG